MQNEKEIKALIQLIEESSYNLKVGYIGMDLNAYYKNIIIIQISFNKLILLLTDDTLLRNYDHYISASR